MSPSAQAVVVGATGEVGAAIVMRLRQAGVPVVAVARDRDRLEQLSATDDGITACPADIGDDSSGEAIAAAVSGPVRMVVQAAAVPPAGPLATIDPDALGRSVSLKLGGLLRLIRAVEDRLVEGSGSSPSAAISVPNPRRKPAAQVSPTLPWPTSFASSPTPTGHGGDCAHDRSGVPWTPIASVGSPARQPRRAASASRPSSMNTDPTHRTRQARLA